VSNKKSEVIAEVQGQLEAIIDAAIAPPMKVKKALEIARALRDSIDLDSYLNMVIAELESDLQ